tara:strand:- start:814 stop:2307 length:1494 start_codon:yes stop_codon:yes gene_type:complete
MALSSNRRQRIIEFATPKVADLVVVELVDASKNLGSADAADNTSYGTAHPDTANFPNHKLSLIKNGDKDQGQFQLWYYVVDRADQDEYNWEFRSAGAGSRYDTVIRTYVTLRTSYDEATPAISSSMPSREADPFTTNAVGFDPEYILFERRQVRAGDETLDSLYVIEQQVFIKKIPVRNIRTDDSFAYDITLHEDTSNSTEDRGTATDPSKGALLDKETLFYKTETIKATTVFATTDDAETTVSTTGAVNALTAFRDPDLTYATGITPIGTSNFWGTDELGIQREGKQLSDNWYVLFERQVVPPVDTTNVTDKSNPGEVVLEKYQTNETYTWPAVLNDLDPTDGNQDGIIGYSWKRRKGGSDTVVFPTFKRDTWTGPTKTIREKIWRKKQWSTSELTDLQPMQPLPINFVTPLIKTNVKQTLHKALFLGVSTGTEHPIYNNEVVQFNYGRTNYTDWPASLVVSDSQQPFRGGYVRTKITVHAPNITVQDPTYAADPS